MSGQNHGHRRSAPADRPEGTAGLNAALHCPELPALLDRLCPMHVLLDAQGRIRHAGPTLCKLVGGPERALEAGFFDLFDLRRPLLPPDMAALCGAGGVRLHLELRLPPQVALKGMVCPLPAPAGSTDPAGGAVVTLSFGIAVRDAVRSFGLTAADFAAIDLTVEMLYLIEANAAAMQASRHLNLRLEGARIAAEEQAFTDTLTGLRNRRALAPVLERLLRSGQDFALMALDLDRFKVVNDRLGHAAGDRLLQEVACRMVALTRDEDVILRVGGDEFLLILPGLGDAARLARLGGRLIAALEAPLHVGGEDVRISASAGAVLRGDYPPAADPDDLTGPMQKDADRALYAAKGRGRGCCILGRDLDHGAARRR